MCIFLVPSKVSYSSTYISVFECGLPRFLENLRFRYQFFSFIVIFLIFDLEILVILWFIFLKKYFNIYFYLLIICFTIFVLCLTYYE